MLYTIGDVAKKLGVRPSVLRYYDKEGLLPHMSRSQSGIRMFTDSDLEWFHLIERLKRSGMPIKEIKEYVDLYEEGDSTLEERRDLLYSRKEAVLVEMEKLKDTLDFITYKCWFYDTAVEAGTVDVPHNMPDDEIPADILEIKRRCLGKGN